VGDGLINYNNIYSQDHKEKKAEIGLKELKKIPGGDAAALKLKPSLGKSGW
jgi:hypothetical protein